MPVAELIDGRVVINSEYRERELIKLLPGAKWDTVKQTWWAPLSWATCIQLRGIFNEDLKVGPELARWSSNERNTRIAPCLDLRRAEDADIDEPGLYPFQRAGVLFLATAGQALCADDMGLGKTVQGIRTLEQIGDDAYPALVICPNSKKFDWMAEYKGTELVGGFNFFAPDRRVIVINGGAAARRKQIEAVKNGEYDVGIINWEGIRLHTRLAGYGSIRLEEGDKLPKELNEVGWKTIIADEAHKAKDPKSKQTRALWWLGDHATYRFGFTGTPVANSPEDMWALMRFVSPTEWPTKTKMIERYALQSWSMFGFMEICGLKSETKDELFKILDPRFIRRTKAAVLPQLPPKIPVTRTVELGAKQRKAYEQIRKEMLAELEGGILLATNPLTKMTRLLQFASASGVIQDGNLVLTDPSCKVDALEEIVQELGEEQAIVFAESRQLIELAYKRLVRAKPHGLGLSVGMVTGTISPTERSEAIAAFTGGKHRLMLMTLGAGAEGLSFPGCSTAIFLQRSFNAVKNVQAEDRIYGIGRGVEGKSSTIIDVVAKDTIESRVHQVRAEKAEMLEEFARDAETLKAWLAK